MKALLCGCCFFKENPDYVPIFHTFALERGLRGHLHPACSHLRGQIIHKEQGFASKRLLPCIRCCYTFVVGPNDVLPVIPYILNRFELGLSSKDLNISLLAWFDNIIDVFFWAKTHYQLHSRLNKVIMKPVKHVETKIKGDLVFALYFARLFLNTKNKQTSETAEIHYQSAIQLLSVSKKQKLNSVDFHKISNWAKEHLPIRWSLDSGFSQVVCPNGTTTLARVKMERKVDG